MRLFPWAPGSGAELDADGKTERVAIIRTKLDGLDVPLDKARAIARRAIWLYIDCRPEQVPPSGDWEVWFLLGGRGSGKTRTGAETLAGWAIDMPGTRWALVAPTLTDVRETMCEGESGLRAVIPADSLWGGSWDVAFNSGRPEVRLANNSRLRGYSSEKPGRLRGPQFHGAWVDEPGELKDSYTLPIDESNTNTTWSNLRLATRLRHLDEDGNSVPLRIVVTGTPKRVKLLVGDSVQPGLLTGEEGVTIRRMKTSDNTDNLSPYYKQLQRRLAGTRVGRQELDAELLTDVPGALVKGAWVRIDKPGPSVDDLARVAVGVDPAGTHKPTSDETGIIVAGLDHSGLGWILEDLSGRYSPGQWRDIAVSAYNRWRADAVVAEVNFGYDLVRSNIERQDQLVNVVEVRASRGKALRAEPIAGLYEVRDGEEPGVRIRHAKSFPELVDQWTTWVPPRPGQRNKVSPDRLDAEVHVMTWLTNGEGHGWDGADYLSNLGHYQ